ncbi:BolA family protein [Solimonas marina]|uniref:BolA family transcriptional regulator n=1 Tax=Solimonas marina TaxID=2714601 RepID=A0A970B8V6_9GAMM|nr:BolA family protein [Solimonas marina]NKF22659.1 BolA family transcriptional regulator [Solimonas marina]
MSDARIARIEAALVAAFAPDVLKIDDESHLHAGHAGARSGRGHYRVEIVTDAFAGQAPLARHRAVYAALGELMTTDIHALSIQARTPSESRA